MAYPKTYKSKKPRPPEPPRELVQEICDVTATSPYGYKRLRKEYPHWPERETFYAMCWTYQWVDEMFDSAKLKQANTFFDEIRDIIFDEEDDFYIDEEGKRRPNLVHINRHRLQVDTLKWGLCKVLPKVWGDKFTHEQNVNIKHEDSIKALE